MTAPSGTPAEAARAGRLPPYSEDAEKGVLGSVLQDGSLIDLCVEGYLTPESFYVPAHRALYDALLEMSGLGRPIDLLTVADRLKETGRLDRAGGDVALHRLVDSTPTTAHAAFYVSVVREKHVLRRIIECARTAENECYATEENAYSLLGRVEQSFFDITDSQRSRMAAWPDMVREVIRHVEDLKRHRGVIKTGYGALDNLLVGLRPANMIVLAARPSMGKTSLAMNIVERAACGHVRGQEPYPVGVFSLEMSREDLVLRMLCTSAEISMHQVRLGYVKDESDWHRRLIDAASRLGKAPILLDDSGGLDVTELRARARRMKHRHEIALVVIDYLQLLHSREYMRQGRQVETGAISGELKDMAKELNVPVLVLSQLSRAPENREGVPRLSDLRDSGSIEQDADAVLLLRRPCRIRGDPRQNEPTLAIVEVAKNRNGPTGEVEMDFDDVLMRFSERMGGVDRDRPPEPDTEAEGPGAVGARAPVAEERGTEEIP